MTDVAVTGLGLATGLGLDLETSWRGLIEGRSPVKEFRLFDPDGLASPFGVELPDGAEDLFRSRIKKRHRRLMTRGTAIAIVTAQMAIEDSGIDLEGIDGTRVGVVAGTTGTGYVADGDHDPHRILRNMSNSPASWISLGQKLEGPSFAVSTACSSGVFALASAHGLIERGECDVVVAGAADSSLNRLDVQGFSDLMALAEDPAFVATASRPFDRDRTGFVMGEGGGFLILESLEHARRRGAEVLATMPAPALTTESYNIMSPKPGGVGMARTMRLALDRAGLDAGNIDWVNAHGTSTEQNDRYEVEAIADVLGDRVPVSSTKALTGHLLAGAAGAESVICVKAIVEGTIPHTAHLENPEPGVDHVREPREARLVHVMCNSFAFGGHNGVAVFSRPG